VRAELKSLDSADALGGLASFQPDDPEDFAIVVGAVVGSPEAPGGDLFYFTVCTGRWLTANPPEKAFAFLKGHVLLDRWNYDVLQRAISDVCTRTEGSDWNEVATKLSRYGNWEFEDYREAE
jgi:Immunity protein 8